MFDAELEALVDAFADCTLPPDRWTHQAHLCVATWYLFHFQRAEATERIRAGIQRYNAHLGNAVGYHETITLAWIGVIHRLMHELQGDGSHERAACLAQRIITQCNSSNYLLTYYRRETLFSEEARKCYIPPDIRPIEETNNPDL